MSSAVDAWNALSTQVRDAMAGHDVRDLASMFAAIAAMPLPEVEEGLLPALVDRIVGGAATSAQHLGMVLALWRLSAGVGDSLQRSIALQLGLHLRPLTTYPKVAELRLALLEVGMQSAPEFGPEVMAMAARAKQRCLLVLAETCTWTPQAAMQAIKAGCACRNLAVRLRRPSLAADAERDIAMTYLNLPGELGGIEKALAFANSVLDDGANRVLPALLAHRWLLVGELLLRSGSSAELPEARVQLERATDALRQHEPVDGRALARGLLLLASTYEETHREEVGALSREAFRLAVADREAVDAARAMLAFERISFGDEDMLELLRMASAALDFGLVHPELRGLTLAIRAFASARMRLARAGPASAEHGIHQDLKAAREALEELDPTSIGAANVGQVIATVYREIGMVDEAVVTVEQVLRTSKRPRGRLAAQRVELAVLRDGRVDRRRALEIIDSILDPTSGPGLQPHEARALGAWLESLDERQAGVLTSDRQSRIEHRMALLPQGNRDAVGLTYRFAEARVGISPFSPVLQELLAQAELVPPKERLRLLGLALELAWVRIGGDHPNTRQIARSAEEAIEALADVDLREHGPFLCAVARQRMSADRPTLGDVRAAMGLLVRARKPLAAQSERLLIWLEVLALGLDPRISEQDFFAQANALRRRIESTLDEEARSRYLAELGRVVRTKPIRDTAEHRRLLEGLGVAIEGGEQLPADLAALRPLASTHIAEARSRLESAAPGDRPFALRRLGVVLMHAELQDAGRALEEAVFLLQDALEAWPGIDTRSRLEVVAELGTACWRAARHDASMRARGLMHLESVDGWPGAGDHPIQLAEAHRVRALLFDEDGQSRLGGTARPAIVWLEKALALAPADHRVRYDVLLTLANHLRLDGEALGRAIELHEEALALVARLGLDGLEVARASKCLADALRQRLEHSDLERARSLLGRALELREAALVPGLRAETLLSMAELELSAHDQEGETSDLLEAARQLDEAHDLVGPAQDPGLAGRIAIAARRVARLRGTSPPRDDARELDAHARACEQQFGTPRQVVLERLLTDERSELGKAAAAEVLRCKVEGPDAFWTALEQALGGSEPRPTAIRLVALSSLPELLDRRFDTRVEWLQRRLVELGPQVGRWPSEEALAFATSFARVVLAREDLAATSTWDCALGVLEGSIARERGRSDRQKALCLLGVAYFRHPGPGRAERHLKAAEAYEQGLEEARHRGDHASTAALLLNRGTLRADRVEHDEGLLRAIEDFEAVVEMRNRGAHDDTVARALTAAAWHRSKLSESHQSKARRKALRELDEAEGLAKRLLDDSILLVVEIHRGIVLRSLGNRDAALRAFKRAEEIATSCRDQVQAARVHHNIGDLLASDPEHLSAALKHLCMAFELRQGRPSEAAETLHSLLLVLQRLGEPLPDGFAGMADRLASALSPVREMGLRSEVLEHQARSEHDAPSEELQAAVARALLRADELRAGAETLEDELSMSNAVGRLGSLAAWVQNRGGVDPLEVLLRVAPTRGRALHGERKHRLDWRGSPPPGQIWPVTQPAASAADLKQWLEEEPGRVLIELCVTGISTLALVLALKEDRLVTAARELAFSGADLGLWLTNPSEDGWQDLLRRLNDGGLQTEIKAVDASMHMRLLEIGERLVRPLEDLFARLDARHLVFDAPAGLAQVPLGAVAYPRDGALRYLIEDYESVRVVAGLHGLTAGGLKAENAAHSRAAGVVAVDPREAPRFRALGAKVRGGLERISGEAHQLPGDGCDVSTVEVLDLLRRVDLACLLCHGGFDPDDRQWVRLALGDGQFLGFQDLARLETPLRARWVLLAACQSARTSSQDFGAEWMGMSGAFLRAGASDVVAALWDCSVPTTVDLMLRVIDGIGDGVSLSVAIARAARGALEDGRRVLRGEEPESPMLRDVAKSSRAPGMLVSPVFWAPLQLLSVR